MKIHIAPKNGLVRGVTISAFINPNSTHTILMLSGLTMHDLKLLEPYQVKGYIANNTCVIDLNVNKFDILD